MTHKLEPYRGDKIKDKILETYKSVANERDLLEIVCLWWTVS